MFDREPPPNEGAQVEGPDGRSLWLVAAQPLGSPKLGDRTLDRCRQQVRIHFGGIAVAIRDGVSAGKVYALIACTGSAPHASAQLDARLKRFAAHATAAARTRVIAAMVGPIADPRCIDEATCQADEVLLVLAGDCSPDAASVVDVRWKLIERRIAELLAHDPALTGGPIEILQKHDSAYGGQLCDTLEAYLRELGDVAAAAAYLGIHRNTVRYRLDKARAVAGIDLRQPEQRFGLMVQLMVRRRGHVADRAERGRVAEEAI